MTVVVSDRSQKGSRPIDSDGKSTGDDLKKVDGERDKLVGLLQERCGYARGPVGSHGVLRAVHRPVAGGGAHAQT